jgi:hypothetical protein
MSLLLQKVEVMNPQQEAQLQMQLQQNELEKQDIFN